MLNHILDPLYERIFQNTLKENLPSSGHGAITSPADPDLFYRNQKNYSTPGNHNNLNYLEISACSFTQAYTDPSLSTAEKEELTSALTDLIENDHDIANEMFQTYTNLKQLVSPCSQGEEDRNCDAGGNLALTVLDALIGEGLDPNEELMTLNNQIYLAESPRCARSSDLVRVAGGLPDRY